MRAETLHEYAAIEDAKRLQYSTANVNGVVGAALLLPKDN